jgi:phospholipase C
MTRHQHASDLLSRSSKPADCKAGPWNWLPRAVLAVAASLALLAMPPKPARADGDLHKVNHIIIVMMENHSFDNYLGTLPYVHSGPYHHGPCKNGDHKCVDGLACTGTYGSLTCSNSNADDSGSAVHSFHEPNYCVFPDLDHEWADSHAEANFMSPNDALMASPNDGFVRMNDLTDQPDLGGESATEDETMGYYTQTDLPFYYSLASTFAIDDRYFSSVLGPTFPNRSYLYAATSFGHVLAIPDEFPPAGGYKPITGTIFDLLNNNHVTWANYFADVPATFSFLDTFFSPPHVVPVAQFFTDAATGNLPSVAFVDPSFGFGGIKTENDEHPPTDIRKGQYFVSLLVQAVRNSPEWKDSIVFIVYDEAGGAYDHVAPPKARQDGLLSPDLINPGLCEDLSNPPASLLPGGGANCNDGPFPINSLVEAELLCPELAASMPGYPTSCANFNQLGFRVPFIAVSPFSKPHYVSHTVGDHTSLLALIEKRFFHTGNFPVNAQLLGHKHDRHHLTARDRHAHTLEDMFDFNHSPSLNVTIPAAPPPSPSDPNCALVF